MNATAYKTTKTTETESDDASPHEKRLIGWFRGRAVAWGVTRTINNQPQVTIEFETATGAIETWHGSVVDRPGPSGTSALDITRRTVKALGFKGTKLGQLREPNALDTSIEVRLRVEEEWFDGRWRRRVASVSRSFLDEFAASRDLVAQVDAVVSI